MKKIGSRDDIPGLSENMPLATRVSTITNFLKTGSIPKSLDIREMQPILDAGTALDQWNTAALAVVGTAYSALQAIAAPVNAANRVVVFWKCGIETAPSPVSRLIFRSGGAAGNILALFDLEQLVNWLVVEGYFSEPVVIDPTQTYAVQVLCRIATGVLGRVQLGAYVFEPAGQTIA
ncbi:MAG: hypothetical protein PHZ19_11845 [Candidatus Thermoplasmatota archaeon]|nr:hypothetical protein [Candidatus Thermoplasmatota archaeon]